MTTLAITPNWKNKSAKFRGTVAAGEHVSVTIQNDDGEGGEFIADASTLRLRVVDPANGRTLAIFPEPVPEGETPETWDSDLSPLRCTLNLNTVQMLKAVPPAANVPLLFVLDDYENKTLYFKEQFPVEHWPRLRGEEEPTDLDNYKDIIADFNERLDGYDTRITGAENAAQAATENASAATAKANQAVDIANQAVDKAETAQNSAAASAEAAHNSALAAEEAQEAAESAAESIDSPDATLTEEGVAAEAKATGEAIAAEKTRAETAEAAEKSRAEGVESGLDTRLTAAEKAINDEALLRAAADADLESNKADKATTYTKTEVDSLVAAMGKCIVVDELPDPADADRQAIYLVPQTGKVNVYDEYIVVEPTAGTFVWNQIGDTEIDLSNYATKADATLTIKYVWDVEGLVLGYGWESLEYDNGTWTLTYNTGSGFSLGGTPTNVPTATVTTAGAENATKLTFTDVDDNVITATRRTVLQLGEQSDKPIQPAGDYIPKEEVVAPSNTAKTGQAADAKATHSQLAGKLGNSGDQTLNGTLTVKNGNIRTPIVRLAYNTPDSPASTDWLIARDAGGDLNIRVPTSGGDYKYFWLDGSKGGSAIALLSDIYAAVQQIAPAFAAKAYAVNNLCTYNGALYRCKMGYTATASSAKPDADTTHWEAKKVSELFLPLTGGTMSGQLTVDGSILVQNETGNGTVTALSYALWSGITLLRDANARLVFQKDNVFTLIIPQTDGTLALAAPNPTAGNLAALDASGNPTDSGIKASDKLDSTSAAPAFSTSSTYAVDEHCTYDGKLYRCTTAVTTAGAWTGSTNWTAEDMTTPDATLDVTATDKLLRLVATNGDVIWGQGYNLSTESSATVLTEQVSAFTFAADASADQAIVLPSVAAGKVGDFILDVVNLSANDRSLTLTGLDSAFSVVVKAGDDLSETLTVAAGEMARYYFTMTAFRVNSLPTWQVAKEAVENGGAQS